MKLHLILKRPIITEKSLSLTSYGKYTFQVDGRANKREIAQAVQKAFGVHVRSVKTTRLAGKKRRVGPRRKEVATQVSTKAIVQLAPEEKIDLFTAGEEDKTK